MTEFVISAIRSLKEIYVQQNLNFTLQMPSKENKCEKRKINNANINITLLQ
jgi:hypothetical protein